MKSLLENVTGYFNKRTKYSDAKSTNPEKQIQFIDNGECAQRLLKNTDFALMFNLYRFNLLERLEDSKNDAERITNSHYISGARDMIDFIELTVFLSKGVQSKIEKN
jgi:hypothetical protein